MMIILSILFAAFSWCNGSATTRRVPTEYPTIQSALDALMEGDTVLVDTGLYEEALLAPSLDFVLRGNVIDTTGEYLRPIVDPSSLPDPTGIACLRQDSGRTVIEDVRFRNRWPMFPHVVDSCGGVYHPKGHITVRRCVFDSTYTSITAWQASLTLSRCDFRHISGFGPLSYDTVWATDCDFQSDSVLWAQLTGRDGSRIERCHFSGNYGTQMILHLGVNDVQIRDCIFGPGTASAWYRFAIYCNDLVFENNVIEDWQLGQGMLMLDMLSPGSARIRNNIMRNCIVPESLPPEVGLIGFDLWRSWACDTCQIEFDNNVIENCHASYWTPGVMVGGSHQYAHHNRFTNISPAAAQNFGAAWILRDNLFYGNQQALVDTMASTDAEWNWWGDATGPYHATLNPLGQGDSVRGNVDFMPFYTDTSFFQEAVSPRPGSVVPAGFSLSAYPNPFNPAARLTFSLSRPEFVTLDVYNIVGEKVRELVKRRYEAGSYSVQFDARELPTGIYFAQMRAGSFVKTEKMVLLK